MPGLLDQIQNLDPQTQAALLRQMQGGNQNLSGILNQQPAPEPGFMDKLMQGVQSPMFRMGQGMDIANSQHRGLGSALQGGIQALQEYPTQQLQGQFLQGKVQSQQMENMLNQAKIKQMLDPNFMSNDDRRQLYKESVDAWKAQQDANSKGYFLPGHEPKQTPMPTMDQFGIKLPTIQSFNYPPMTPEQAKQSPNLQTGALVQHATELYPNVDPILVHSIIHEESGGNTHAVSPKGAQGMMQLMPETAKELGVTDPHDPAQNIIAGTKYIGQMLKKYGNDPFTALAAYNWGPGHVDKWLSQGADPAHLPHETQNYIAKVMGNGVDLAEHQQTQMAQNNQAPQQNDAQGPQMPQYGQMPAQQPQYIPLNDSTGTPVLKDGKQLYQNTATGQREWRTGTNQSLVNDSNAQMNGDEFLSTLPADKALLVKKIANGEYIPSGRSQDKNDLIAAASQYDPSFDAVNYNSRAMLKKDATSGKLATSTNALSTALGHAGELINKIDDLHNSNWRTGNTVGNTISKEFGGDAVTNFNQVRDTLTDEIIKAYRGSGGAEADIQRQIENLDSSNSPKQLRGTLHEIAKLLQSKIEANQQQYVNGMGGGVGELPKPLSMTTEAAEVMRKLESGDTKGAKSAPLGDGWKITVRKP